MSIAEEKMSEKVPAAGSGAGVGMGSSPDTLPSFRETTVPTMPGRNGGTLKVGNPGHNGAGTGRPADKVRKEATESLEQFIGRIGALMGSTVGLCESEIAKGEKLSVNSLAALLNQVSKLAATLTSIGPGTKVTNVVEREGYHDAAHRAYTAHDGTLLDFLQKLKVELDGIP